MENHQAAGVHEANGNDLDHAVQQQVQQEAQDIVDNPDENEAPEDAYESQDDLQDMDEMESPRDDGDMFDADQAEQSQDIAGTSNPGIYNPRISAIPDDDDDEDINMLQSRLELLSAHSRNSGQHSSRPPSAVMNLRGSRPNSAAVAQEIEGFEDDFMERVEEEEEDLALDEQEEEQEEEQDVGPTIEELVERAQQEQQRLQEANEGLQRKARIAMDFRNKGRPIVNRDVARLDGVNVRYKSSLKQWMEILEERDRVEGHYQTMVFDMKSSLEERIKRADDISKAYKHFRVEVAKSSEHSKTGRAISERLLGNLEHEDQEKEEEVQRVRLKNIHLSNQLKRIEQTLRQKEELAEGLHLIDFEQLKIENQSLNEKIEERNEELLKLRKKTTTTVQILTHIREKLQFIEKENASLTSQLEELDRTLSERRDKLGKAKAVRDTLRHKGRKIKETSMFITNPVLLHDIEAQKEKREQLMFAIEELKKEHTMLSQVITKSNSKIIGMTEDLAAAGAPNVVNILRSMQSQKSKSNMSSIRSRVESSLGHRTPVV